MDFESLEVFVEVSAEKPQEIISLHLTEDCKLVVDEVQREFATTNELLDHRMTFPTDLFGDQRQPSSTGSSWLRTSSTPTYNVTGNSNGTMEFISTWRTPQSSLLIDKTPATSLWSEEPLPNAAKISLGGASTTVISVPIRRHQVRY